MKILVIGSGGREHALIKSMKQSATVEKIFVLPGNDGMAQDAQLVPISINAYSEIVEFCISHKINFVFIGPEEPSVLGMSDYLRQHDIACIAPSKNAAQLEGSKIFAKEFMIRAGIPTARSFVVTTLEQTLEMAKNFTAPYILKADGLAAGKGVFICKTINELEKAAHATFVEKKFGGSGERALLEENLPGTELSFHVLTNGKNFEVLPLAQDHKRLGDNNTGPNTGGMGTVAPLKIPDQLYRKIIEKIVEPTVQQISKEQFVFRGIIFIGLMIVNDEPYTLEYNTRFGDPETQVILPLIKNDTANLFLKLALGELEKIEVQQKFSFCLVNAAPGYPDHPEKGLPITIDSAEVENHILYAGVSMGNNNQLQTSGGRVLNVISTADSFAQAQQQVYEINKKINFKGRQFRSDIGNYQFQRSDT